MKTIHTEPFPTDTPSNYPTKEMNELFAAICSIESEKEAENFFRDLLTMPEIKEFANRWQIVKLLTQKKSYATIAKKLNVSTATVTRVAHWLRNGTGGYKALAERTFDTQFKDSPIKKKLKLRGKYTFLKDPNSME